MGAESDRDALPERKPARTQTTAGAALAASWIAALVVALVLVLLDLVSWRTGAAIAVLATGAVFVAVILTAPNGRGR